jgi:hypothetical protein
MVSRLADLVERWCNESGVAPELRPTPAQLEAGFWTGTQHCRPGTDHARLLSWERRFGFALPESLKAWLRLSDGFYGEGGPLVHPLAAIGPMIPFARMPGLVIQPESWFELGNPNLETICIDLAYRWPGGDCPLFTSGDDERGSPSRIIAPGFTSWFLRLLHRGGAEFWFDPGFASLGDPWAEHRRKVPAPPLPDRLIRLVPRVRPLVRRGLDDRKLAAGLGVSRGDVEAILRHLQHAPADYAEMGAELGA